MRMSKKSTALAQDLYPGDVIRLVYEIKVDEIGDLDAEFPSVSDNLFFIKGVIVKGPMRKADVKFAISGEDKINIISRKSFLSKVRERLGSWGKTHANTSTKKKEKLLDKAGASSAMKLFMVG